MPPTKHNDFPATTIDPTIAESAIKEEPSRGWTPLALQDCALAGVVLCFVILLVALATLEAVDAKHDGLATTGNDKQYFWTYGPTALPAVVMAFWGQVEHRTKQLIPWSILHAGPTSASSTLFIEYVTLSQPEVLFKSLKEGRWVVSLATIGSVLLKLLTVASTGLLTIQTENVTINDCNLVIKDKFGSNVDPEGLRAGSGLTIVALADGNISKYPVGTSETLAFPTINLFEHPQGTNISVVEISLDVFRADLKCEPGYLEPKAIEVYEHPTLGTPLTDYYKLGSTNGTFDYPSAYFDIHSESCKIYFEQIDTWVRYTADGIWSMEWSDYLDCVTTSTGRNSSRMIFAVGKFQQLYAKIPMPDDLSAKWPNSTGWNITMSILNQTLLSCIPTYTIKPMVLRLATLGNLIELKSESDRDNISNIQLFHKWDLGSMFFGSATTAVGPELHQYTTPSPILYDSVFQLLKSWHDSETLDEFLNQATLENSTKTLFSAVSAQLVKQNFMETDNSQINGKCHGTQKRLRINNLSLRIMQAVLASLTALTICIRVLRPNDVLSRDPGSIGGLAVVVARSHALQRQLSGHGISSLLDIYSELRGYQCENKKRTEIELSSSQTPQQGRKFPAKSPPFWRPFAVMRSFTSSVFLLLVLLTASLEVTFRISQTRQGLATAEEQSYSHYAWSYIPALVMLSMQLSIGAIAFSCLLMAPYEALKHNVSSTRDILLRDYLSQTAIQLVLESGLKRDWTILPIALSLLLTPMLTMAVSGLFTVQVTHNSHPVNVTLTNVFNATGKFNGTYGWIDDYTVILERYFISNYSLLAWTSEEFVFPEIRVEDATRSNRHDRTGYIGSLWNGSVLSVKLPALQPSLDCSLMDCQLTSRQPPSWICPSLPGFPQLWLDPYLSGYNGSQVISTVQTSDKWGMMSGAIDPIPGECPTLLGVIGVSLLNFTTFICKPSLSEITVMADLSLPSYDIKNIRPNANTYRKFMDSTFVEDLCSDSNNLPLPDLFLVNETEYFYKFGSFSEQ